MRINRDLFGWGVFFVLAGGIPLAVRNDLLDGSTVERWWTLWPLFLIAGGLGILLRATPLSFVGGLLAAVTFGLMAGGFLATGGVSLAGCSDRGSAQAFPSQTGELGPRAEVEVDLNCGELDIVTTGGRGWQLSGTTSDGTAPRVDASDGALDIEGAGRVDPFLFLDRGQRWELSMPTGSELALDVGLNAGVARLELEGAVVRELDAELNAGELVIDAADVASLGGLDVGVNAGSARIALPNQSLSGQLEVNAGDLRICTPPDAGVRIIRGGAAASFDLPGLTERQAGTWETPDYAAADVRIELRVGANAASVALNPGGGCNV